MPKQNLLCVFMIVAFQFLLNAQSPPKYIFFFIGDGMGQGQIQVTEEYLKLNNDSLCFTSMPVRAMINTFSSNRLITGSAAAGTALATGHKTTINSIGVCPKEFAGSIEKNSDQTDNKKGVTPLLNVAEFAAEQQKSVGDVNSVFINHANPASFYAENAEDYIPLQTVAEFAAKQQKSVGIVSSVFINHATPASFYAKNESRYNYYQIAEQLPASGFNYFGGGSIKNNDDGEDLYGISAHKYGYHIISDLQEIEELQLTDKIIALSDRIDGTETVENVIDETYQTTNLQEYTESAIRFLSKNKNGFFLMVEGGKIDWMCHHNDVVSAVHEVVGFSEAVEQAVAFYEKHPDETLIIVTADHETGGLALGANAMPYLVDLELFDEQKISGVKLTKLIDSKTADVFSLDSLFMLLEENFGFNGKKIQLNSSDSVVVKNAYQKYLSSAVDAENIIYNDINGITEAVLKIMSDKTGIGWTSTAHTAAAVPLFVMGSHSELFEKCSDNTDIAKLIFRLLEKK